MAMHRTNICLPVIIVSRLQGFAKNKGISFSELVRRILDEWLDRQGVKDGR